jgi:hypothetical protein
MTVRSLKWLLHPHRFKEWIAVARIEAGRSDWRHMLAVFAHMAGMVLKRPFFRNELAWEAKYEKCKECPIFNPTLRQCSAETEKGVLGCGCYMPFKALFSKHGWLTEQEDEEEGSKDLCW